MKGMPGRVSSAPTSLTVAERQHLYVSVFICGSSPFGESGRMFPGEAICGWLGGVMDGPVAIDNVEAPGGGRIGLVHCPGMGGHGVWPLRQDVRLDQDLATLSQWGARSLVTLLQPIEMQALGVDRIGDRARAAGLDWWHLPIADGCAPGASFEREWDEAGAALHEVLDTGGRIVLHCRAGIGRTGTVAARLLIDRGVSPADAVVAIRRVRPGAIESSEQMAWVQRQSTR